MNGTDSVSLQQNGGIFLTNKETFPVGTFMFRRLVGDILYVLYMTCRILRNSSNSTNVHIRITVLHFHTVHCGENYGIFRGCSRVEVTVPVTNYSGMDN
jgi:hypothetical protein